MVKKSLIISVAVVIVIIGVFTALTVSNHYSQEDVLGVTDSPSDTIVPTEAVDANSSESTVTPTANSPTKVPQPKTSRRAAQVTNQNTLQPTSTPTPTQSPFSPQTTTLRILNSGFQVPTLTIRVQDTIIWKNTDNKAHKVVFDNGTSSPMLQPNQSFSHTFTATGTYTYHCGVHPSMTGVIKVIGY